jgi:oligopeptide transport system substrate-binding protein
MWHDELGIDMDLRQVEWKVYLANSSKVAFDVCRASWIGDYNDADTFLNMWMSNNGNNRTGWKNAHYDDLIRNADRETDAAKREKLLQEAETMLVSQESPIVPIYFYIGFNYHHANIQGVYPNILDVHPLNAIYKSEPEKTSAPPAALKGN